MLFIPLLYFFKFPQAIVSSACSNTHKGNLSCIKFSYLVAHNISGITANFIHRQAHFQFISNFLWFVNVLMAMGNQPILNSCKSIFLYSKFLNRRVFVIELKIWICYMSSKCSCSYWLKLNIFINSELW